MIRAPPENAGRRPMHSDENYDEVRFWLEMIHQWESTNAGPAPERMYQALNQARVLQRHAEDFISVQTNRPN